MGEDRSLSPASEAPDGWVMYFNGAFSRQGAGAGVVLISPTQDKLYYAVQLCFQHGEKVSNNIAEYEGLIAGLKAAVALGVKRITIKRDLQLLVNFPTMCTSRRMSTWKRTSWRSARWRNSFGG